MVREKGCIGAEKRGGKLHWNILYTYRKFSVKIKKIFTIVKLKTKSMYLSISSW